MQVAELDHSTADIALKLAEQRAAELAPDLRVVASARRGSVARGLLECAVDASMLVVSARGGGGVTGLPLGSVSRYLATHAPCPVVITRQEAAAQAREIAVGVRDVNEAQSALHFGFAEARLHGAQLAVMHALVGVAASAGRDHEVRAATGAELAGALAPMRESYRGVGVRIDVAGMHPSQMLCAASGRSDLVVLGRSGEGGRGLRTVIHAVLAEARVPVAIVPGE
jgi:nucleotide-binding universal stress UspA family protein